MRITVPEGADPMVFATTGLGDPELNAAKTALTRKIYNVTTTVTPREMEAARARLARINGCAFCMRYRPARDRAGWSDDPHSIPEELYEHVEDTSSWPGYSVRELLAIRLAEKFALDHLHVGEDLWAQVHANFSDDELIDLMNCIAVWTAFGRMNRMLEVDDTCSVPAAVSAMIAAATTPVGASAS